MRRTTLLILFILLFILPLKSNNVDTINNRVSMLFKQERYSECYNLAKDLYGMSVEISDSILIFNSLYYMGFANQRLGKVDDALVYNLEAYDVALELNRLDLQSSILNNIGNVYMVNDKDSVAAVYFEKSIEIERSLGDKRMQQLAVRLGNVSTAYMKMGKYDEAIAFAEEGLRIDKKIGKPDKIAIRQNQLGNVYHASGRIDEAMRCERESYKYFEKTASKYGMSVVSHSLGDLMKEKNIIDSAIYYYENALSLADDIDNNLLRQKIFKSLYKTYKTIDVQQAIVYLERYMEIRGIIFDETNQQMLNDFQIKYDTKEKDMEIEMHKEAIKYNRNMLKLGLLLIFLLLIILLLLVNNIIARKKRNRALVELNEIMNRSISVLSHDLKNPVIAQKMVLDFLNDNIDKIKFDDVKIHIAALSESVTSLEELLINMLEWTKFEAHKVEYIPMKFDVRELCFKEILPLYKSIANKKKITIKECDEKLDNYQVYSDNRRVSTVLRNLISNAIKFSHEGNVIEIVFIDLGDKMRIVVKDNGIGMSEDKIHSLLSGSTFSILGTNKEEGSGLGIDIVNKNLLICESELNIISSVGSGSEFSFEIGKQ